MKPRKSTVCVALLCALAMVGCGQESSNSQASPRKSHTGTIVAIGDSLTEGFGIAEEFSYPAVLQRKLDENGYSYRVVNAGVSGETSSGALSRIQWALTLDPDIVILATGANDGLRGIDPTLVKANINAIVDELKAKDVIVVLAGMQIFQNLGKHFAKAFAEIYPQIADEQDLILIPFFLEGVGGRAHLNQADGIHPTAEGYRIVVENIYPHIIEAIQRHQAKTL